MKKLLSLGVAFLLFLLIAGCSEGTNEEINEGNTTNGGAEELDIIGEVNESIDEADLLSVDETIANVLSNKGYSEEHSAEIEKIMRTVGVDKIVIETMTGEAENGLNSVICYPNGYTDENRRFYFTTENGVLFYAGFKDEDLYDKDKGGFLKSYDDVHVPETTIDNGTKNTLKDLTESVLDKYFKNPPYYDGWAVGREDDNYAVQCQAYAKNGLGAKDWVFSKVWYHYENDEFTVKAVSIDGVQYEVK